MGKLQGAITAEFLRSEFGAFDALHGSDYSRTHAIPMQMKANVPLRVYSNLNERNMGIWHTTPEEEIKEKFKPKVVEILKLGMAADNEEKLQQVFAELEKRKAQKQSDAFSPGECVRCWFPKNLL